MKKNILIVSDSLRTGGIQTALKNLLEFIDYSKYNVSIFLFNDKIKNINKNVNLLKSNFTLRTISLTKKQAKEKGIIIYLYRIFLALICKILGSNFVYNILFMLMKKNKGYDLAVSFSNNGDSHSVYFGYNKYVLKKVTAKKKVSWLHVDYEAMNMNNKYNNNEYKKFDRVVCVSKYVEKIFLKYNPNVKTSVVYNFNLEQKEIENCPLELSNDLFKIITVGRLDENKNPLLQLEICKKLKEDKINFKWIFVGEGTLRSEMERYIIENKLNDEVMLLGNKENVHSYLKYSDIYVSTSKSESYGLSISEALSLNKIVIALEYPAIHELIDDNGIVCKDKRELYDEIFKTITNKKIYNERTKKAGLKIKNNIVLNQLNKLLEEEQ